MLDNEGGPVGGVPVEDLTVGILRELLRHLQAWRALYEADGVDVLDGPEGFSISLWDLEAIYGMVDTLPPRQAEAIELCLVQNIRERDAAVRMGVSPTNPVAMYATSGLEKLVKMVEQGEVFRKYRETPKVWVKCRYCSEVWEYQDIRNAKSNLGEVHAHISECGLASSVA